MQWASGSYTARQMDPPPIQYARTPDGVNIAYAVVGNGPPLVYLQPFSHQQLDWTIPELSRWFASLSAARQVIRYDGRRFGLSDRPGEPITLDSLQADLAAVIDAVGAPRVDLVGISGLGLPAIAYAAAEPRRVGRLVLWGAVANGRGLIESDGATRVRAFEALYDIDPNLALELVSRMLFGEDAAGRPECMTHTRESMTVADLRSYTAALRVTDVTPLLSAVTCPTLLMLPRGASLASADAIRMMATSIPSCEVSFCEGEVYPHRGAGADERLRVLEQFLSGQPAQAPDTAGPDELTRREIDVLDRLARGAANQDIAQALGLSVRTVERHITNLYRKIDARSRTEATVYALKHGLGGDEGAAR